MKRFFAVILILVFCFSFAACGSKKDSKGTAESTTKTTTTAKEAETETTTEAPTTTTTTEAVKKTKLPEKVKIVYNTYVPGENTGWINEITVIGDDMLKMDVTTRGQDMTPQGNYAWHYFKSKGDGKWDDYYTNGKEAWRLYRENIGDGNTNPFLLPAGMIKAEDTRYKDNATDQHETVNITGLGDLDTIILTGVESGGGGKLWYSEKLHMYVKGESDNGNSWKIVSYDTTISDFGMEMPK